jgi:hypothetical protein
MSIFSVLGSIGKAVGKTALGAAGGVLSVATGGLTAGIVNANMFDSNNSAAQAAPVAQAQAAPVIQQTAAQPTSIGGAVAGLINSFSGFFSGQTHAQVDLHTQIGGTADPLAAQASPFSSLPPWLLYGGIGLVAFMALKPSQRR